MMVSKGYNLQIVEQNNEIILKAVLENPTKTRAELIKITGMKRSTIYDILVRLIIKKQVQKIYEFRRKPGRPKSFYIPFSRFYCKRCSKEIEDIRTVLFDPLEMRFVHFIWSKNKHFSYDQYTICTNMKREVI